MSGTNERRVVNETTGGEKGQKDERFDLVPAEPMRQVALHYGIGARKYADRNWERGYDWSLSIAALERHLNAFKRGEDIDEETQSPHLAAVIFHALALLEFTDTHPELDDRVKRALAQVGLEDPIPETRPVLYRDRNGKPLREGDRAFYIDNRTGRQVEGTIVPPVHPDGPSERVRVWASWESGSLNPGWMPDDRVTRAD